MALKNELGREGIELIDYFLADLIGLVMEDALLEVVIIEPEDDVFGEACLNLPKIDIQHIVPLNILFLPLTNKKLTTGLKSDYFFSRDIVSVFP